MHPDLDRLDYTQARSSPCAGCDAPCCTYLPLHTFQLSRYEDLDYAFYLLNFDRIELALMPQGQWRVMYRAPCGHLDLQTRRCGVHGTATQPEVCKRYSAYSCFYKRLFESPAAVSYIRMDRGRLEAYAQMLVFNGHRDLVGYPDLESVRPHLPPLAPPPEPKPVPPAPKLEAWKAAVQQKAQLAPLPAKPFSAFIDRCMGCEAWCCTRLSFPQKTPTSIGIVDFIRYCLGFPGVEVGVDWQGEWTLAVRTTCRHRVVTEEGHGRCGVVGEPARPHVCSHYDATLCGYRARYAHARPARTLRMEAEHFTACVEMIAFDDDGQALRTPTLEEIRAAIEQRWIESV